MPRLLIIIGGKKWIKLPQIPNPATQVEHYQSILHSSACHLCRPLTQWWWQGDVSVKCRSGCESARPRPEHFPSLTFQKHGVCVCLWCELLAGWATECLLTSNIARWSSGGWWYRAHWPGLYCVITGSKFGQESKLTGWTNLIMTKIGDGGPCPEMTWRQTLYLFLYQTPRGKRERKVCKQHIFVSHLCVCASTCVCVYVCVVNMSTYDFHFSTTRYSQIWPLTPVAAKALLVLSFLPRGRPYIYKHTRRNFSQSHFQVMASSLLMSTSTTCNKLKRHNFPSVWMIQQSTLSPRSIERGEGRKV